MIEYSYDPPYNLWSGNRSDTLNKWKINYKGSIATASALPEKGDFKGDTYNVLEDGSNYMWNGTSWDKLDANTYVGATSEASGIRGLVPPATTAQMYSLLTGSGVWKSGVELGFAYDNAVVHLTGDESVGGEKAFFNDIGIMLRKATTLERGVVPQEYISAWLDMFIDGNGKYCGSRLLGVGSNGLTQSVITCYPWLDEIDVPAATLAVGFGPGTIVNGMQTVAGMPFATAPSTQIASIRNEGTDIVTRDFIPKDNRICHTAGDNECAYDFVHGSGNVNGVRICGGSTGGSGASIILLGPSHASRPGGFSIHAHDMSDDVMMTGDPDGSLKWNGQTIQTTSDERLKTPLSKVPDAVLDAWEDVNWGQFQYLDAINRKGELARLHLGLIAQHVMSIFEKHGLDACAYGILCHEEREATNESNAVEIWMVRYAEAQAMEAACQRRKAERAEARIKALEDRLEILEAKLG